jgi:hypothetical protein
LVEGNEKCVFGNFVDGQKNNQILNLTSYKKNFSEAWLGFLRLKMNQATYVGILEIIHQTVIPHFNNPIALMDFFVDAYDAGIS